MSYSIDEVQNWTSADWLEECERLLAEDGRLRRFNEQNIRQVFIDAYTRACQRMRKHGECTGKDLETDYEAMCKATPGIFLDTASTRRKHVCGLRGFRPGEDICPVCDEKGGKL